MDKLKMKKTYEGRTVEVQDLMTQAVVSIGREESFLSYSLTPKQAKRLHQWLGKWLKKKVN